MIPLLNFLCVRVFELNGKVVVKGMLLGTEGALKQMDRKEIWKTKGSYVSMLLLRKSLFLFILLEAMSEGRGISTWGNSLVGLKELVKIELRIKELSRWILISDIPLPEQNVSSCGDTIVSSDVIDLCTLQLHSVYIWITVWESFSW